MTEQKRHSIGRFFGCWIIFLSELSLTVVCLLLTFFGFGCLRKFISCVHRFSNRGASSHERATMLMFWYDRAVLMFPRRIRCLAYSAGAVCVLRLFGFPAECVLGVTRYPFAAHAWVEVDAVVLCGARSPSRYVVLDRF
jgi:hypothetical protein